MTDRTDFSNLMAPVPVPITHEALMALGVCNKPLPYRLEAPPQLRHCLFPGESATTVRLETDSELIQVQPLLPDQPELQREHYAWLQGRVQDTPISTPGTSQSWQQPITLSYL
jgi:hypothetical protein